MIRHNQFSPGVQSLAIILEGYEKSILSAGVIEAGERYTFTHTRLEAIRVTSGEIIINGVPCTEKDGEQLFQPGGEIVFEAQMLSSYLCLFPSEGSSKIEEGWLEAGL